MPASPAPTRETAEAEVKPGSEPGAKEQGKNGSD